MECYRIENLTFTYPEGHNAVLDDICLSIEKGEFVTICGRSGCGKTTLLRQLKPSLSPHGEIKGKVLFFGEDIRNIHLRDESMRIGFVQQNPDNMIVTDKVWHELAFGLESLGMQNDEIRIKVAEMSAFFGIEDIFNSSTAELSGGQKQLLNLASVMVMNPDVLILDEPTSQLDPIGARSFLETLKRVNREFGTTIIICEHRTEEIFAISDRIVIMDSGKVVAQGTPGDLIEGLKSCDQNIRLMLPTPMRVFGAVPNKLKCPVTVNEGKKWLGEMVENIDIKKLEKKQKDTIKGKTVVTIDEVFFRYERDLPDVLKGVSAKIYSGEICGIVGGNGAGKSTFLSVMSGIRKPYRGRVTVGQGEVMAFLPQNPQVLFLKKTVSLDLMDMLPKNVTTEEICAEIDRVAKLCEIQDVLDRHPYDLSGGEQQRVALAKILLLKPSIILMDEPTKGMDVVFKRKFGTILKRLKKLGCAVVIVSHDIEFCAENTDRCMMLFDGNIVSQGEPETFFAGKQFYTTSANRMARDIIPDAVLAEDIIEALGGEINACEKPDVDIQERPMTEIRTVIEKEKPKSNYIPRLIFGFLFGLLFVFTQVFFKDVLSGFDWKSAVMQIATLLFLTVAVMLVIPTKFFATETRNIQTQRKKGKLSARTILAMVITLIAIPLTIYAGIRFFSDRRYYLISLLIIFEIMLPFFVLFEGKRPQAGEIVIISVLCAIAIGGRLAFLMIPQFKPILAIIIVAGVCLGGETGFLVGAVSGFVSNFYFGQGPWTPWQMFAMGMVGFLAGILSSKGILKKSRLALSLFGGFATIVFYGGIMNPASIIMMQQQITKELLISTYLLGLPLDLVHGFSTACFLWLGGPVMIEKIDRIKSKYGIMK